MISIIGAGPAGNYLAYLLSRQGERVQVFEEHPLIGKPVQCTGITTLYLKDIMAVDETFLVNTIDETRVYGPSGDCAHIALKDNYIVDRHRFDSYLGEMAMNAGARFHFGKRFNCFKRNGKASEGMKLFFQDGGMPVVTENLVGADGPGSAVAHAAGLYGKRTFVVGMQARMSMKEAVDASAVDFYLGEGHFGWVVPENKRICRVGIASDAAFAKAHFDGLVRRRPGKILEWQSGMIPLYDPFVRTEDSGVYLVGDAATMVKATTYGGIIPGMMASEELCRSILDCQSYGFRWRKRVGFELLLHRWLRTIMNRMGDAQFDQLVTLAGHQHIRALLHDHDREFPSRLLAKLLVAEPRLALLGLRSLLPI